jgi:hypothetical protein
VEKRNACPLQVVPSVRQIANADTKAGQIGYGTLRQIPNSGKLLAQAIGRGQAQQARAGSNLDRAASGGNGVGPKKRAVSQGGRPRIGDRAGHRNDA